MNVEIGLEPCNSFSGNICFEFSAFVLCSVVSSHKNVKKHLCNFSLIMHHTAYLVQPFNQLWYGSNEALNKKQKVLNIWIFFDLQSLCTKSGKIFILDLSLEEPHLIPLVEIKDGRLSSGVGVLTHVTALSNRFDSQPITP
jgi:hypothetical protein